MYDRETYWSDVAGRMAARTTHRDLAGDADAFQVYKHRKILRRFLSTLPVDGKVVMELGCGPGGKLEWLLANRRLARVIGVDISATMLRLAAERLGARATLHKADGKTIPLPDASVDLAYTVTVLQHNVETAHMHAMVAELARVSRGPVVLMEDLAAETMTWRSWIVRRLDEYQTAAAAAGLHLESATPLRTRLSRAGHWRLQRLFTMPEEGARRPWLFRVLSSGWVAVARHLDDRVEDHELTKMVFSR